MIWSHYRISNFISVYDETNKIVTNCYYIYIYIYIYVYISITLLDQAEASNLIID